MKPQGLDFKKAALRTVSLFAHLREADLELLASRTNLRVVEADTTLFEEGAPGEELFIVLERGKVTLWKASGSTQEFLGERGAGAVIGEMSLLDGQRRSATGVASARSRFLTLHKNDLLAILETHPGIALKIIEVLCDRLRQADDRTVLRVSQSVPQRLGRYLLDNAVMAADNPYRYVVRLGDRVLAERIGTQREVLNRTLGKWHRQGIIERGANRIHLCREDALRAIISGDDAADRGVI